MYPVLVIPGMTSVPITARRNPISPAKMPLREVFASDIHLSDSTKPMAPARYSSPMITARVLLGSRK